MTPTGRSCAGWAHSNRSTRPTSATRARPARRRPRSPSRPRRRSRSRVCTTTPSPASSGTSFRAYRARCDELRLPRRDAVLLATFVAVSLALLTVMLVRLGTVTLPGSHVREVRARFANAEGLPSDADVLVHGVKDGSVTGIAVRGGGTLVTLSLSPRHRRCTRTPRRRSASRPRSASRSSFWTRDVRPAGRVCRSEHARPSRSTTRSAFSTAPAARTRGRR